MNEQTTLTAAAPSAGAAIPAPSAPASAPAPAPAPSAPANDSPKTLADFESYAIASLNALDTAPTAPAAPAGVPASESPAETPTPAAPDASGQPDDVLDPTPEELALLTEAGQRALKTEREKRKAAREEVKSLQAKIADLEARLNPSAAAPSAVAPVPPEAPAPVAPVTPSVPPNLAQCRTFDQVEAQVLEAVRTKAIASELMMAMNGGDRETVIERLTEQKVTAIGGTPLAEASDAQLRQLIVHASLGCEMTLAQAPQRRAELNREAAAFGQATQILPGLGKPGDKAHEAFRAFVAQNPNVRLLGPQWPVLVAEGIKGRLGITTQSATTPAPAAAPAATPRSAPGAPRTAAAATPGKSELDQLQIRIASGQATTKDMQRYAELSLG